MAIVNSTQSGSQEVTLAGLKRQYKNLLSPLEARFWSKELTCAPAIEGKRYEESPFRLMYVGRAVNGWEGNWKGNSVEDLVNQVFSYDFDMASIEENPNQNGYNFNKSPFWQLCKPLMKLAGEEKNWSDRVLWSNLYKVAPYETGNPSNKLIKETIDYCVQILIYELELYKPSHAVFVTDDWWFDPADTFKVSFSKELGIPVEHKIESVIIGKGIYQSSDGGTKIIVTKRPEGLKGVSREEHAKLIFEAFASLE